MTSIEDWCIFGLPKPGADSEIGRTERIEVARCTQPGYRARVVQDGVIAGAHFVQTPDYVQVTGVGDLTKINIPQGDEGGELDPHDAARNSGSNARAHSLRNLGGSHAEPCALR